MLPALFIALVAFAGEIVHAGPLADKRLVERQGEFDFCSSAGTNVAQNLIFALGPLAGTSLCYSLLNVPKTTVTTTQVRTLAAVSTASATTTVSSAAATITSTVRSTVLSTSSVSSTTTVATTGTIDSTTPMRRRQNDGSKDKGKGKGNNPPAPTPTNGDAKSRACRCALGASPTQTLTATTSSTRTSTSTSTRLITSTLAGATITSTTTSTSTSTVTSTATASATAVVHFTQQFPSMANNGTANCGYTGATNQAGTSQQNCLDICASASTCQTLFIQVNADSTINCQLSTGPFAQANVVCDATINPNVASASGYSRGATTVQ